MRRSVQIQIEMPDDLAEFRLPDGVRRRLQHLLDLQEKGTMTSDERHEAEGLVDVAELLTLLRLRSDQAKK